MEITDRQTFKDGGAEGSRTPDLLIANETLYQLSYDPNQLNLRNLQLTETTADFPFHDFLPHR